MHRHASNNHYSHPDDIYQDLVARAMENGFVKSDRTGTGTHALFGEMARYNLINGRTPRLTTKKLSDNPEREMLWFRDGTSSIKTLRDQGIGIWNSWLIEGTAKYAPLDYDQMTAAILKHHKLNKDATVHTEVEDDPAAFEGELWVEVRNDHEKSLTKPCLILHFKQPCWAAIHETTDGSYAEMMDASMAYACKHVGVDTLRLVDGDIGSGGYGPQWRHWQDTQIIARCDLLSYQQQGYKVKGHITPETDFNSEAEIQAALIKVWKYKGFNNVKFTELDLDELPEQGYDVRIDTTSHDIEVVYHAMRDLEAIYINAASLPYIVVHREIDQLANAIELLKTNPDSRRIIVTAWNPAKTWQAALPPCHLYFQFVSHELTVEQRVRIHNDSIQLAQHDERREEHKNGLAPLVLRTWNYIGLAQERASGKTDEQLHAYLDQLCIKRRGLSLFLLMRSQDIGLGNPFNIAQYAALNHMVAQVVGMEPLELCWAAVDAHVYNNHLDALKDQVKLTPLDHCIPRLKLNPTITDIDAFTIDDIEVIDYEHYQALTDRMPVAV